MKYRFEEKKCLKVFYCHNYGLFLLSLICTILSTFFSLFFSWIMGELLNIIIEKDMSILWNTLYVAIIAAIMMFFCDMVLYRAKSRFIHKALIQYRNSIFERLSQKEINAFVKENVSKYISSLINDVGVVEEKYLNGTLLVAYYIILFVGSIIMMIMLSWKLTLITLVLSMLPILFTRILESGLISREQLVSKQNEKFMDTVKDFLNGFSVIKNYKAEKVAIETLRNSNISLEYNKMARRWWDGLIVATSNATGTFVQFGIFFWGAWFVISDQIEIGTVLIIFNLCNFILQPIQMIPSLLAERKASISLIKKIDCLLKENTFKEGRTIETKLKEEITMKNVTFGYDLENIILKNINMKFQKGKKYAIVGASGSGKSTILKLLMGGVRDYRGSIFIDGNELNEISTDSLYDIISLVSQEIFIFNSSIQNNITMFKEYPIEEVKKAFDLAGLSELVEDKGLSYCCGENGCNLSGGERQRIALARSVLRGSSVIMLDEAVAALDNHTATKIEESILKLKNVTEIVVTHRLNKRILQMYDEIVVIKDGEVYETGQFDLLMEKRGYFYSLYCITSKDDMIKEYF